MEAPLGERTQIHLRMQSVCVFGCPLCIHHQLYIIHCCGPSEDISSVHAYTLSELKLCRMTSCQISEVGLSANLRSKHIVPLWSGSAGRAQLSMGFVSWYAQVFGWCALRIFWSWWGIFSAKRKCNWKWDSFQLLYMFGSKWDKNNMLTALVRKTGTMRISNFLKSWKFRLEGGISQKFIFHWNSIDLLQRFFVFETALTFHQYSEVVNVILYNSCLQQVFIIPSPPPPLLF